jgi:uncharacterized iron-regulated membrane protein
MSRRFWLLLHRYAGLALAVFLAVAGLTGSVLAFKAEIDLWLNPEEYRVPAQDRPMLDIFDLRDKALALEPHVRIDSVRLGNRVPGEIFRAEVTPATNPATGEPYPESLPLLLNPYTGDRIIPPTPTLTESGEPELWPVTRKNILLLIYGLHWTLLAGDIGLWIMGIVATIWTVDCFVGFYLTFPKRKSELHFNKPTV